MSWAMPRKTRAPALYERYAWATGSMAAQMVNWFGDGNTYVGSLGLKPETANTFSTTADWHGENERPWALKISPYYTNVTDYIGVEKIGDMPPFAVLRFANHDAYIYGADVTASARLWAWSGTANSMPSLRRAGCVGAIQPRTRTSIT